MIHIIQNDPDVGPGSIERFLPLPHTIHHSYRTALLPQPGEIAGLIVLGGSMGADDDITFPFLRGVRDLMGKALLTGIPLLGICLGAQMLAMAAGGGVTRNRWGEEGCMIVELTDDSCDDPLFRGIDSPFVTFQWHHDSVDLPPGSTLLARSPACPHQAFRVRGNAWGVQFHPEITEEIITLWTRDDQERGKGLVESYRTARRRYDAVMERLMNNFAGIVTGSSRLWRMSIP